MTRVNSDDAETIRAAVTVIKRHAGRKTWRANRVIRWLLAFAAHVDAGRTP